VKMFDADKTSDSATVRWENFDDMLSRFHLIPARHGQTDRIAISIARVSVLTRDKNDVISIFKMADLSHLGF